MRAVVDGSVLVSAFLVRGSLPEAVLGTALAGRFELALSPPILTEITRSLGRPKLRRRYRHGEPEITTYITLLEDAAGIVRGLIRKVLRGQHSDVFRVRKSSPELYLPWLDAQWSAGERNGAALWRRLAKQGFRGCLRVVTEQATRRRQADRVDDALSRAPSARTIARLMTIGRDRLSKSETVTVAAIEGGVTLLVEARELVAAFQAMVRKRSLAALEPRRVLRQRRAQGQASGCRRSRHPGRTVRPRARSPS